MEGDTDLESKANDFGIFLDMMSRATSHIEEHYFQLPVAEKESPVYRERVYCYELYHRIRESTPDDYFYKLDGELDKRGHPLIHNAVGPVKPDFLVHERGQMNNNLIVIEVKPINARQNEINEDVRKLCKFLNSADYFRAIYLVYGEESNGTEFDKFISSVEGVQGEIPQDSFYLTWHQAPRTPFEKVLIV